MIIRVQVPIWLLNIVCHREPVRLSARSLCMTSDLDDHPSREVAGTLSSLAAVPECLKDEASPGALVLHLLAKARIWLQKNYRINTTKRLRIVETVSLGEKRFVALVRVEEYEFLVGGGASGINLLARIKAGSSIAECNVRRTSK